ncbi:hypothetical protein [Coprobacter sp.]
MKKLIILLLFNIYIVNSTFCNEIEDKRTPLFHYPGYTIENTENGYKIYKGNPAFSSNLLYTIEYNGNNLKIFKGNSSFSSNLIYAIESDNKGYKIYKGNTNFSSNLIYALEYTNNGYKIYKGDPAFLSNLTYTVEYNNEYYKVYKGSSTFSSNLIYYMSREALEFFKDNKIRKEKNIFNQFLFQPQLLKRDKQSGNIQDLLIDFLLESLLEHN